MSTDNDIVTKAIETRDPKLADLALREIEKQIHLSGEPLEKVNAILGRAVLYGILHRFEDARKEIRTALREASPDDIFNQVQADFIDASLYDEEGKPAEAYEHLTRTLLRHEEYFNDARLRSIYEDIQQRRGFDLIRLKRFDAAIPILKEVLCFKLEPLVRSSALANLGLCYVKTRAYDSARDCFERAVAIGLIPEWEGQVHYHLAFAYANLKLLRESKKEFEWCAQQPSGRYAMPLTNIYGWLSRICRYLGEQAESEEYARLAHPI